AKAICIQAKAICADDIVLLAFTGARFKLGKALWYKTKRACWLTSSFCLWYVCTFYFLVLLCAVRHLEWLTFTTMFGLKIV
ncbi:MAG: hypothetical protein ACK5WV_09790, partial [Chryseotalea sp.]